MLQNQREVPECLEQGELAMKMNCDRLVRALLLSSWVFFSLCTGEKSTSVLLYIHWQIIFPDSCAKAAVEDGKMCWVKGTFSSPVAGKGFWLKRRHVGFENSFVRAQGLLFLFGTFILYVLFSIVSHRNMVFNQTIRTLHHD